MGVIKKKELLLYKLLKNRISFLLFFCTIVSWGQGQLTGVSTKINMLNSSIHIDQEFIVDLLDSINTITLKALNFRGATLSNITINDDDIVMDKEVDTQKLKQFIVATRDAVPLKKVILSYTIQATNSEFYIPLFFTNLPAANSNIDFFKGSMQVNTNTDYNMLFPKVTLSEIEDNAVKEVMFNLPALPSMIRIQINQEENILNFWDGNNVDILVALLFIGIGIIIWKNRKRLAYG